MKRHKASRLLAILLSVFAVQTSVQNVPSTVNAVEDISTVESNLSTNTNVELSEDAFKIDALPNYLISELEPNLQNSVRLDEDVYNDLYSVGTVNEDGTKSLFTFNSPIKYYDNESKRIKFIDNRIVPEQNVDGVSYVNQGNSYQVSFPEVINEGLELVSDQYVLNMKPVTEGDCESPQLIDNEIVYDKAFGESTIIHYALDNAGIKESIIISEPNTCDSYDFIFTATGLTPDKDSGESITFIDENNGESVFVIQPTYIVDSYVGEYVEGEEHVTYNNYYDVENLSDNTYLIHMNLDKEFLNADSTVYPCVIDPSVWAVNLVDDRSSYVIQSGGSGYINNELSAGEFNGSGEHLSYIKAKSVDKYRWIEPKRLLSATFNVKASSYGYTNSCTIDCYDSNVSADVSSVTYSQLVSSLGSLQSSTTFTTLGKSYSFDVTSMFRKWIQYELGEGGKNPEYGFILRGATGKSIPGRYFSSTSSPDTYFYLTYQEGEELEDGFYNIKNVSTGTYLRYNSGGQLYLSSSPSSNVCKWQIILSKSLDRKKTYGVYTLSPFNNLNVSVKGESTGTSVTTNSSGNEYRIVRNSDGTFRIMPSGANVSNAIGISSNYATIQEYSNISSMKWTFEPVVNRYFSEYSPEKFNVKTGDFPTQYRMNCYGYAFGNILYYGDYTNIYRQQPGDFVSTSDKSKLKSNSSYNPVTKMENIVNNIKLDASRLGYTMSEYVPSGSIVSQYGANSRLIALVTGISDYHFYMQHNDGTWSHKPGATEVTNLTLDSIDSDMPVYLTNENIISSANQGSYSGGQLKFFVITRDAVPDHPHGKSNNISACTLYYKDIAGDLMFTSTDISVGTKQASIDYYDDVDYYAFTPNSTKKYTLSTACNSGYDIDGAIYDSNGNLISKIINSGQINQTFDLNVGKRYFVEIYNFSKMPCEYTITIS